MTTHQVRAHLRSDGTVVTAHRRTRRGQQAAPPPPSSLAAAPTTASPIWTAPTRLVVEPGTGPARLVLVDHAGAHYGEVTETDAGYTVTGSSTLTGQHFDTADEAVWALKADVYAPDRPASERDRAVAIAAQPVLWAPSDDEPGRFSAVVDTVYGAGVATVRLDHDPDGTIGLIVDTSSDDGSCRQIITGTAPSEPAALRRGSSLVRAYLASVEDDEYNWPTTP